MSTVPFRVILPAGADRIPWLEARRTGIGSSDVANILGVGGSSAQHVYYDKVGALPIEDDDAGEAAFWGTRDEATTADVWAERNRSVVRRIGLIARKDQPWQMCTLDRQVRECPLRENGDREICALEIKHRVAWKAGQWKRSIPDDVLAQVLWQMVVTGYSHIHVACRIGGVDYRQYVIRRKDHEALIADIIAGITRFWTGNVLARRVPALTGTENVDRMLDLFEALHPDRDGYADLTGQEALTAQEHLLAYEYERLRESRAKKAKEAAKTALIEALGDHTWAYLFGQTKEPAFGWESETKDGAPLVSTSVDMDRLAERHPEAYRDCVREKPSRRIAISKRFRLTQDDLDRYEKGDGDVVSA